MGWPPGDSRARQPECDADRQVFTRRIYLIYLTVKHPVTAAHERLSRATLAQIVRIFLVNSG
jgi:hypothetical protein